MLDVSYAFSSRVCCAYSSRRLITREPEEPEKTTTREPEESREQEEQR